MMLACGCSACAGVEYTHDDTCVCLQCLRWCRVYSRLCLRVFAVLALVSSILTIILACGCSACSGEEYTHDDACMWLLCCAGVKYTHDDTCVWLQCLRWCRVYSR